MAETRDTTYSLKPPPDSPAWQRLSPLAWRKFIPPEVQPPSQITLSESEVQNKCFAVLGYLKDYQLFSTIGIISGEGIDLGNEGEARSGGIPRQKSGMEQLVDLAKNILQPKQNKDQEMPAQQRQAHIEERLKELLSNPQVKDRFEKEFSEELPHYESARGPMKQVRNIDSNMKIIRQALYRAYLEDKNNHGGLTQSTIELIGKFQKGLDLLEQQKKGIEDTVSPATLGYLEAQKLLDYKRQLQENGFVMTPSREDLVDRITREALAGKKIFLVGSTGTGKTQLAFYALNNLTEGYELINWHEGTTPRDLFGYRELWTDELGGVQSGMKPGPIPRALERETDTGKGVGVIHEEYTGGSTRTQLAAKFMMGARPGDRIQIPGFNGQVFDVTNNFIEVFTGNPKDEKTKQREDMDPAILRELTGVEVNYMNAREMDDIIRAKLITESGVLKLTQAEIEYIDRLTKAAEMMQRIHNRDFDGFSTEMKSLLGIDAQGNTDTTLNTNFLDPGTLFKLFSEWELASARGQNFESYMGDKLGEFVTDPKTLSSPEERKALQKILHAFGLVASASGDVRVTIPHQDKGYILPSEMAGEITLSNKNPMGAQYKRQENRERSNLEQARQLFGKDFLGPEAFEKAFDTAPESVPEIPFSLEELERARKLGQMLVLRVETANGENLTMEGMKQILGEKIELAGKGKILYDTTWYKEEGFFTNKTPQTRWVLVSKEVLPNSTNKNYLQQTQLLADYLRDEVFLGSAVPPEYEEALREFETQKTDIQNIITSNWQEAARILSTLRLNQLTRQTPAEVLYDMLVYFENNDQRLLGNRHTWTNRQARGGSLVYVGSFASDGADVYSWTPGHSHDAVGVVLSRS